MVLYRVGMWVDKSLTQGPWRWIEGEILSHSSKIIIIVLRTDNLKIKAYKCLTCKPALHEFSSQGQQANRQCTHGKGLQMSGIKACSAWVLNQQAHLHMRHKIAIHVRHLYMGREGDNAAYCVHSDDQTLPLIDLCFCFILHRLWML